MAREAKRKIIGTKYTYKRNNNGKIELVKKSKPITMKQESFKDLRNHLIKVSKGDDGQFVKFTKQYQSMRVAVPRKIKYFYQENKDGTFSRTYFKREPRK